jgi:predicted molibdopterin-dependent oxidoreductase YjgC
MIRSDDGELHEASWDEALAVAARGLTRVADTHGADALGFVSSSRCTVEENYLVQKLARAVFHTNNVHQCAAT